MVKGISRRVIVVESPDPRVFDQAIFILRNDILSEDGVSSRQLVDQAVRMGGGGLMGLLWLGGSLLLRVPLITVLFYHFFSSLTDGQKVVRLFLPSSPAPAFVLYWGKTMKVRGNAMYIGSVFIPNPLVLAP